MDESILNTIKVNLYENYLTDDPNDLSAKVISEHSLSVPDICKTAVNRAKALTTPKAMEHNVMLFFKEMAFQLMNGFFISTGYFTAGAQVRGVFNNPLRIDCTDSRTDARKVPVSDQQSIRRGYPVKRAAYDCI